LLPVVMIVVVMVAIVIVDRGQLQGYLSIGGSNDGDDDCDSRRSSRVVVLGWI
uniref:Secreted protein n=1 Tax=Brugia timori TaxID=42155 RepID=A0A0R3QNH6_9BILA